MGVLAKFGRRIWRLKEKQLTMATTAEECTENCTERNDVQSTNNNISKEMHQKYDVDEPLSPHHGTVITTPTQQNHQHFFDDFDPGLYADDDEMTIGPMILLHTSNCSSSASHSVDEEDAAKHSVSRCQAGVPNWRSGSPIHGYVKTPIADDTVLDPSFEISLVHLKANEEPSHTDGVLDEDEIPQQISASTSEVLNDLLATCPVKPKTLHDHNGVPFVHVYTESLSTVICACLH